MIWPEERLNDGVKLPVLVELFVELFKPALPAVVGVALPPAVVTGALLSPPAVGCAGLCVGGGANGVCAFAAAPPANKNASTNTVTKNVCCGTRVPLVKVEDCDMSVSFYYLKLRNLAHWRVMG